MQFECVQIERGTKSMSGESALAVRSWPVGVFTCELTVQRPKTGALMNAVVEWTPAEPPRLSTEEWRQYRAGRNRAIAELAAQLGISVAVLEL